jgi:hypothetical protein
MYWQGNILERFITTRTNVRRKCSSLRAYLSSFTYAFCLHSAQLTFYTLFDAILRYWNSSESMQYSQSANCISASQLQFSYGYLYSYSNFVSFCLSLVHSSPSVDDSVLSRCHAQGHKRTNQKVRSVRVFRSFGGRP